LNTDKSRLKLFLSTVAVTVTVTVRVTLSFTLSFTLSVDNTSQARVRYGSMIQSTVSTFYCDVSQKLTKKRENILCEFSRSVRRTNR